MAANLRPFWMTVVQAGSCFLFAVLYGLLLLDLATSLGSPIAWLSAMAAVPIAYLAADLASGLVHFLCDRFLEADTPVVGRLLIHPFREHHHDPMLITRHDFIEVNGNVCLALAPVLAIGLWLGTDLGSGLIAAFLLASPEESLNTTKSWPSICTWTGSSVTFWLSSAAYQKLMNMIPPFRNWRR